ncbi:MAG: NAD(P)H-dependent oxidoreductase subunit E [Candidatus Thermoplasmatota archaeon]
MAIEKYIKKHGRMLLPILQEIQERYNYLPEEILKEVAEQLNMSLTDVYSIATFYRAFSFKPKGKHVLTVCLGTACHVRGGGRIVDALSRELGIESGSTTKDNKFTLETVNCLGCCALGPVVVVDGKYNGSMNVNKSIAILRKMKGGKND